VAIWQFLLALVPQKAWAAAPKPPIRPIWNGTARLWTVTGSRKSEESVTFNHLLPGKYRASLDGKTWTPIVVTSLPDEQSVEITAPD
jgi:hypothetical protein